MGHASQIPVLPHTGPGQLGLGKILQGKAAGGGGDALKLAAKASTNGPKDPGRTLLQNLLSSKDGAALAAKVIEVMGG